MIAAIAVRTSVVLLAGLALRAALGRHSAALRHSAIAVTLLCAALVIPASFVLPSWAFVVQATAPTASHPAQQPLHAVLSSTALAGEPVGVPVRPIAATVWTAGFLAVVGTLVAGIFRLRQIASHGRRVEVPRWIEGARAVAATYGLRRDIVLIEGASPFMIATWGLRPARLLLPPGASSWSDDRIHAVLYHELAHVARADWVVQIASQVVLAGTLVPSARLAGVPAAPA